MAAGEFLSTAEEQRLVALIGQLERKTTGELHVHLAKKVSRHGVMADAAKTFTKLKIHLTPARNGVLIYIAHKDKQLACLGDKGIHDKVGQKTWDEIVSDLKGCFAKGDNYLGLHRALERIGEELARHYPANGSSSTNALPDEFSRS